MKKFLSCLLAFCMTGILLASCTPNSADVNAEYPVSFSYNYFTFDKVPAVQTVKYGNRPTEPSAPTRAGYKFLGWFTDEDLKEKWDFASDTITKKTVLYAGWEREIRGEISTEIQDKELKSLSPGNQENAFDYKTFFLPEKDGIKQGYVGDTMPYFENGTYYIYYLKDGGDSYNHSVYLATTKDFVNYTEQQTPVLESSRSGGQDGWIGTGSVVKVKGKYYFFYTGHTFSNTAEFKETIMVAESDNLTSFTKKSGWEIKPPAELGQKNDFRDPQAYYDEATDTVSLTVTAAMNGTARILKYSLNGALTSVHYDGVIFTNRSGNFWNLECSDTFKIGDKWYLTYSAQDDTLWYAAADNRYGPYGDARRMEGKLFYAAKHVDNGEDSYMVGWARRAESPSSTQDVGAWAGNLLVQQIAQKENGELYLKPLDVMDTLFETRRALLIDGTLVRIEAGSKFAYRDAFTAYERFMIQGDFTFTGKGAFGLAFDFDGTAGKYKSVVFNPTNQTVELLFNEGKTKITEMRTKLEAGQDYSFTYIQEGSVGVMYLDGECALTVRLYGVGGKTVRLFAENNNVRFSSLRQYSA